MNLQSLLGAASIGKDTTGNFKCSLKGLAVRPLANGKFYARDGDGLIDATDLTIDGSEDFIWRWPVRKPEQGDLLIRSDDPFSVIFVENVEDSATEIEGLDPATSNRVEYCPPTNLLNVHVFVKVISLLDRLPAHIAPANILPLLLCANKDAGDSSDLLTMLITMQALGGESGENALLPFFLLQGAKGESLQTLLLLQTFSTGTGLLGHIFEGPTTSRQSSEPAEVRSGTEEPSEGLAAAQRRKRRPLARSKPTR